MSRRPCNLCDKRIIGKLASAYWSWYTADNKRVAWRQLLCSQCLISTFGPTLRTSSADSTDISICLACGGALGDDLDLVFLTLYIPKQDQREYELNLDAACAAKIRLSIVDLAEPLANRGPELRGPSTPANDPWSDFGSI